MIRLTDHDRIPGILADLLAMHCMRQRDLAEATGYAPGQVSTWVNGVRSPDLATLMRIAAAFDLDLALIPREDTP